MTPTRWTPRRTAAVALAGALALSACSGDDAPQETTSPAPVTADPVPAETTQTSAPTDTEDAVVTTAPADAAAATTGAPDDAAATATAAPAGTDLAAADDAFTVVLPEGWADASDLTEADVLLAARELERKDDFFSNVVVVEEEYVPNLTSAVEDTAQELADQVSDGEYELLDPVDVDGNRAPGYSLVRDVQGTRVHQTQRWISHDGTLYAVTLSAVEPQAEAAQEALDQILSSWTWQD